MIVIRTIAIAINLFCLVGIYVVAKNRKGKVRVTDLVSMAIFALNILVFIFDRV